MTSKRFTKAEVEYLLAARKFIKAIPDLPLIVTSPQRIQAPVFLKSEPNIPVRGLVIMATIRRAPPGLPKPLPSVALEWYGVRIRGLNYEIWHDNPDGSVVRGWHEHVWSPEYEDDCVVPAGPRVTRKGLQDVLKWGLRKWHIEVQQKQRTLGHGKKQSRP